ncbi:hypothetical protein ACMD2_26318 [Ananas comosus]|uniref:Uncharacterized protein n=1 Tax=Ananas comosus TaxID=4615 RepID=A0A199V9F9_ANACO|nr:hypothetical protein ACMD2_26318 [Ananas comosus]
MAYLAIFDLPSKDLRYSVVLLSPPQESSLEMEDGVPKRRLITRSSSSIAFDSSKKHFPALSKIKQKTEEKKKKKKTSRNLICES